MVITSAFQAEDAGSIPVARSMKILKNFIEQKELCCIVDIDSTIAFSWGFDYEIIGKLNSLKLYKIIVTARGSFSKTYDDIDKSGIDYAYVYFNQYHTDPVAFKKKCASEIQKRFNVALAVDDDESIISAYRDMGINAVSPLEFKRLKFDM